MVFDSSGVASFTGLFFSYKRLIPLESIKKMISDIVQIKNPEGI